MSTHNIGFYEEISKIIIKYHQICTLFLLLTIIIKVYENITGVMVMRHISYEPHHDETGFLNMLKQRHKSAAQYLRS